MPKLRKTSAVDITKPQQPSFFTDFGPGVHDADESRGPALVRRIALLGAGNIAAVHADAVRATPNVELAGIVDPREERARALAARHGGVATAESLRALMKQERIDAVHVLTPPDLHKDLVLEALSFNLPVIVEKPMTSDVAGARELAFATRRPDAPRLYINHNFVFHPAFRRLCAILASGELGQLESVSCVFAMPLRQLASGQVHHWMFQRPANLLLEQAVHPLSQVLSLIGLVTGSQASAGRPHMARDKTVPRAMSVQLQGSRCDAQLQLHFGATYPVWQINAVCTDGAVSADLMRNWTVSQTRAEYLEPLDNVLQSKRMAKALRKQAAANLMDYGRSTLGLGRRSDPFFTSMQASIGAFNQRAARAPWVNTPQGATHLVELCETLADQAFPNAGARPVLVAPRAQFQPRAIVIGGTGFIGREIVKALTAKGITTGIAARNPGDAADSELTRSYRADIKDQKHLRAVFEGAEFVINAAGPELSETWEACRANVLDTVEALAGACQAAGVQRLVHLSSIAALYLGAADATVTGTTPVDTRADERAYYARAKALFELRLLTLYEERDLPVCILRPGVVVGEGGIAFHTGVGLFVNERHCLGWNEGRNPLPFVLAEDVASAAVAAATKPGQEGRCYNLAGDVRLSAREYVDALASSLGRPLVYHPQATGSLYASEVAKWVAKRVGGRKVPFPSLHDLRSRTLLTTLDCGDAKASLDWRPVADRDTFIAKAIEIHNPRRRAHDEP